MSRGCAILVHQLHGIGAKFKRQKCSLAFGTHFFFQLIKQRNCDGKDVNYPASKSCQLSLSKVVKVAYCSFLHLQI